MIHLYAEHLLNIRTLSIQASLPTNQDSKTSATVSPDGKILTIRHLREEARITLPVALPDGHRGGCLTVPTSSTKDINLRLQVPQDVNSATVPANNNVLDPWTAISLTAGTQVTCGKCSTVLIQAGSIKTWKDLPSEGWAEMMDFWHCHKPDVPHEHSEGQSAGSQKPYSASGKLAIESGIGLIGAMEFVFAAIDVQSVTCNDDSDISNQVLCASCHTPLGIVEGPDMERAYRLRKSQLSVAVPSRSPSSHTYEQWFSAYLVHSLDSQGVRKFNVQCRDRTPAALKLWVFAPNLNISSSTSQTPEPMQVMKVMWQHSKPINAASEELNADRLSEGDIDIPEYEYKQLVESLLSGSTLLPESARMFQDWRVSLLERFTMKDLAP